MPVSSIDLLHFNSCSLFSSQEYKIDSGNLHITDLSLGKTNKEIIPLDLIDAKPRIMRKNNKQLIWASVTSFLIGTLFTLFSHSISTPALQILVLAFVGIGTILLIASLKLQTTSYTYYYANTTTHLFTIIDSQSGDVDHTKSFIKALNKRIVKPQRDFQRNTEEESQTDFLQHLDYLYNYGVVTDMQYNRIQEKVNAKIFGININNRNKRSADIIALPVKNKLRIIK